MKRLKNFLLRHQGISVTTVEVFHSEERGISLMHQFLFFFNILAPELIFFKF